MKIFKPKFWDKQSLSFLSLALLPFSFLYKIIFKIKYLSTKRKSFSVPIICVGNLYLGGTGKTPVSIKIFEILKKLNKNPVIIKKNYKEQEDEILLIKKYCKILTEKRRAEGIGLAIKKNYDVVILDDGFQDFEIKKNLNIICFNLKQKVGNGLIIPSGPLRQNLKALSDCQIIFLNGKKDIDFENKLSKYNSKVQFIYYEYIPENLSVLSNKKLIAFAGIGNPINFFDFLKSNNLNIVKEINYPDHYNYSKKDLKYLEELSGRYKAKLITTEKDYMRIHHDYRENLNYLPIKIRLKNEDLLKDIIKKIL